MVERFDAARKENAYYGDLTNTVLSANGRSYDEALDLADRRNALEALKTLDKRKRFSGARYDRLPGKTSLKEFVADVATPILRTIGLTGYVISKLVPELAAYWDTKDDYDEAVHARITEAVIAAMNREDRILVISHGIGAIATYDVFWRMSRQEDYATDAGNKKIDAWLTLGAPLGCETVKKKLSGAKEAGQRKYPRNIINWFNVSAEDDYMSHDKTVADDFKNMLKEKLVSQIRDYRIFNLTIRFGKSNPHSSVGYLVHPRVAKVVADWLRTD